MAKTITQISNYPFSKGAVNHSGSLLTDSAIKLKSENPVEYLRQVLAFAKDIIFHQSSGDENHRWAELLLKEPLFSWISPLQIPIQELSKYFDQLPIINSFSENNLLTQNELETLAYQRFQMVQYLLLQFKKTNEQLKNIGDSTLENILISPEIIQPLFLRYAAIFQPAFASSPLIQAANRNKINNFKEIAFDDATTATFDLLSNYYNPSSSAVPDSLIIYATPIAKAKALNEILRQLFTALGQRLYQFQQHAWTNVEQSFTQKNNHQPHTGILMAFSRLMSIFDARFNRLAAEQTFFIYNKVLQLERQVPLPDKAFVHLGLAKNVTQHLLPSGSLLKSEKNSAGKDVFYKTGEDVVLNAASIESIKSFTRVYKNNSIYSLAGTSEANADNWKVNDAWLPFNNVGQVYAGLQFNSSVIYHAAKKGTNIKFIILLDRAITLPTSVNKNLKIQLMPNDGSLVDMEVTDVAVNQQTLTISTTLKTDLKSKLKAGANTQLLILSPSAEDISTDNIYADFYNLLLAANIRQLKVFIASESFEPTNVSTVNGVVPGGNAFLAFGAYSGSGAYFHIYHPLIKFANNVALNIGWSEKLTADVNVNVESKIENFIAGSASNSASFVHNGSNYITLKLNSNIAKTFSYKVNDETHQYDVPLPLIIRTLSVQTDLSEIIFETSTGSEEYYEQDFNELHFFKKLRSASNSKLVQRKILREQQIINIKALRFFQNKNIAYVYPLGIIKISAQDSTKLLPDLTNENFNEYGGELAIGLKNILPGQSIHLLFDVAEETAGQTENEPLVEWFYVAGNHLVKLDNKKITDGTHSFIQSGIVKLMLPTDATHSSPLITGDGLYWLVARCNQYYEAAANIRGVFANGIEVVRVLDNNQQETKISIASNTIQQLFPKSANVKTVVQPVPSLGGRLPENETHYFNRVSKRLRHKSRAVQQWDVEQQIIEQFPFVYKAVCYNHTKYNSSTEILEAVPGHCLLVLLPFYSNSNGQVGVRPALSLAKLTEVKEWVQKKSSPFLQISTLNAPWDEIRIELDVMVQSQIIDLPFYQQQLTADIYKFLMPWAFEDNQPPAFNNIIYFATLVDFIDELNYVEHIRSLKVFRNGVEVFDEVVPTSPIHLFASSIDHLITLKPYAVSG